MNEWEEKEILITVKTYPEYSTRHTETVCTAGIMKDSKKLIRLYPVKYRYLDGDKQFKKYQWIKAGIRSASSDSRPESYNIKYEALQIGDAIHPEKDGWPRRWKIISGNPGNIFDSVEGLYKSNEECGTSLGLVRIRQIKKFKLEYKKQAEVDEGEKRKKRIMNELEFFEEKKDLELLPVTFKLNFLCENKECKGHDMSILDWEIGQLYRRLCNSPGFEKKIEDKICKELCGPEKETWLFLGNMAKRQHIFCILGFLPLPKKRTQLLF